MEDLGNEATVVRGATTYHRKYRVAVTALLDGLIDDVVVWGDLARCSSTEEAHSLVHITVVDRSHSPADTKLEQRPITSVAAPTD